MKRITKSSILAIILVFLLIAPILALSYTSTITITESSGTSYTTYPFIVPLNNAYLANQGYELPTGLDVNVNHNGATIPSMIATDRTNIVTSLPASNSIQPTMTFGNTPVTEQSIIVGNGGYITTADDSHLEPADIFDITYKAVFDTSSGSDKYAIYKQDGTVAASIGLWNDKANTLTALVMPSLSYAPSIIAQQMTDSHTHMYSGSVTRCGELFTNLSAGYYYGIGFWLDTDGSPTGNLSIVVRNASDDSIVKTLGTIDVSTITSGGAGHYAVYVDWAVYTTGNYYILAEYSGGNSSNNVMFFYQNSDVYASGNYVTYNGSYTDDLTSDSYFYIRKYFALPATVASGSHTARLYTNSGNFKFDIDGTNVGTVSLAGEGVTDNTGNILFARNGVSPSIDYIKWNPSFLDIMQYKATNTITSYGTLYRTGTVTFTNGSSSVTGSGTTWTSSMVGGIIKGNIDNVYYVISAVPSATSLTLSTPYLNTGGSGLAYTLSYPTAYTTGTVTLTAGSNIVTGAGGASFSNLMVGGQIKGTVDGVSYTIAGYTDSTHLKLSSNYGETGGSGLAYTISYNPYGFLPNVDLINVYNGTITYGNNPAAILATTGALVSADNPVVATGTEATPLDMVKQESNQGNLTGNNNPTLQKNIFTPWFQPWATVTNIPLIGFFLFASTAILIFCVVEVMRHTGSNQFIGGIVMIVGEAFLYKCGIYELWFVIVSTFIVLAIVIMERKPSF